MVEALGERPLGAIAKAEQDALGSPLSGEEVSFTSDGVRGRVVAGPVYMVNARTCRKLMHVAERDGRRLSGHTTLCLSDEGRWEPVG
jgi:surface antigen